MSFILNSGRFGVTDPGLTLLQSATLWLDASDPGSDSQKAQNKGTGGTALDARLGSTTSVDTNDPLLLTHSGTNYLYLPGIAGNNAEVPDSAALSITGDIDIQVRMAAADWTPSALGTVVGKWGSTTATQGYVLLLNTNGTLRFVQHNGGTLYNDLASTVATGFADGTTQWIRGTYSSSTGNVKFYTAADSAGVPSSWTQLGTTVAGVARATSDTTNSLLIGQTSSAVDLLTASIYRVRILNGYDGAGSVQLDANFTANTNQSSFTESSSNAATVTINRATTGRKSVMVTRPVWLFGTDDYMEIADNALLDIGAADDFSYIVIARGWNTPASGGRLISKKGTSSASAGWETFFTSSTFQVTNRFADGATTSHLASATPSAGALTQIGWVRNVTADEVRQYLGSTLSTSSADSTTTTAASTDVLRIGSSAGGVQQDMEVVAVAVFRSALTSTELGQIATYYGV